MAAKFLWNEWRGNLRVAALPREGCESWRSRGPSFGVDAGQGSLGETDGIIIHILSVLFISSKVSCFSSSCWEKWRDPYFWAGQITLSPLGDAAAFNTVSVSPLCLRVCVCVFVFQSHCVLEGGRGWIQGFPVEIITDHNMHRGPVIKACSFYQKYCLLQGANQGNEFILFHIKDWDWRQIYVRITRGRTFIYHLCKLIRKPVHFKNTLSMINISP